MTCCYQYTTYPWENVSSFCYNNYFQYNNNKNRSILCDHSCVLTSYSTTSSSYTLSSPLLDLFIVEQQQEQEEYSTIMTLTNEYNNNESIFNNNNNNENTITKIDDNDNEYDYDYTYYKIRGGDELGPLYNYDVTCGNPLRGLVCTSYDKDRTDRYNTKIEYSLEFSYIPLSDVIKYDNNTNTIYYDWITNFQLLLNDCQQRNVQLIPRFFIHYPGHSKLSLPDTISNQIEKRNYTEFDGGTSPYYGDIILLNIIHNFILEFGKQYDGNTNIAFIQTGLLGFWGEWHTMNNNNLLPDSTKILVLQWYKQSFIKTKVQTRYPFHSSITEMNNIDLFNFFGYHDDSYTYSTLDGYYNDNNENENNDIISWFFWRQVIVNNDTTFWIHSPMGGELRPETMNDTIGLEYILNPTTSGGKQYKQSFYDCIRITHTTYMNCPIFPTPPLLPSSLQSTPSSSSNISTTTTTNSVEEIQKQSQVQQKQHDHLWARIVQHARFLHGRMGYSFQIPSVTFRRRRSNRRQPTNDVKDKQDPTKESFNMFDLIVTVEQIGVAPFYYPLSLVVSFEYNYENVADGNVCASTSNCENNNTNICTVDYHDINNNSGITNTFNSNATTYVQNEGDDVDYASQSSSSKSKSKSHKGFVDCNRSEVQHNLVMPGIETIKEQYDQKTFTFSNLPLEWIEEVSTFSNLGNESHHHHHHSKSSSNRKVSIQFSLHSSHLLSKQSIKFAQGNDGSVILQNILPSKMWNSD